MISLSDEQLSVLMTAASALDWEKRSVFLERVAAVLRLRTGKVSDADVARACESGAEKFVRVDGGLTKGHDDG